MIQAVVFDLDGTLVDSFEDIAAAVNHAIALVGKPPLSLDTIKTKVGHGLRNLMIGLQSNESEEVIEASVRNVKAYYEEHPTDYSYLYPGALETLEQLKGLGIRTAVLSNKADSLVQKIAINLGFASAMDAVWGHREGMPLKPDPASLQTILSELGVSPQSCLIVGDATPDRQLAERAGCHFCAVSYGQTRREEWEKAGIKICVDSLRELPPITNLPFQAPPD